MELSVDAGDVSLPARLDIPCGGPTRGAVVPQRLNAAGSLLLTRPNLSHHIATRHELLTRAGAVLNLLSTGRLRVHVGGTYSLADAAAAHADLAGRRSTGKLLLLPHG